MIFRINPSQNGRNIVPAVFQHEKQYFDQSPLGLTDHFCNSVNKSLVDAVDTFQVWVARNLVTFSLTQCERVLYSFHWNCRLDQRYCSCLCEVMADSGSSPATSAVVAAAQAHYSKNRKRSSSSSISEDDHVKRVNCWKLQPI